MYSGRQGEGKGTFIVPGSWREKPHQSLRGGCHCAHLTGGKPEDANKE